MPVIVGYFGVIHGGLLQRVGRGYTDLCATLLAVGLLAKELRIWKEVDGIFTADPRIVLEAKLLPSVSSAEAQELTHYGSEVIPPSTMEQAVRAGVSIRVAGVLRPNRCGTIISADGFKPGSTTAFNGKSSHPVTAMTNQKPR